MSLEGVSLLTEENDQCPGCHQDFSPIPESDGARTYLSCGHSVCWKCIQTEWCKSTTNDVDLVNCPLCNVEVLICFDGQASKTDEQPLELARNNMNEVLQKSQMRQQHATSISNMQSTPGCSDVLMCQSVDGFVTNGNFPDIPLSIADSIINIAEMGHGINFPTQDQTESLHDRSWSLDIMNFQDILEKNDISQHLSQDSIFSDHSDSDMGSVQDILKIANLPGESLLDDNSLNAIFLPDNSNDSVQSNDNLKNSLTHSEISAFSHFLRPTPTPLNFLSQTSSQDQTDNSFGGVEIQINEAVNSDAHSSEPISAEQRNLLESLEAENGRQSFDQFGGTKRSRGRRRYNSRGRGRGRGRKKKGMCSLSDMDQTNSETQSAVASIQDNCVSYPSMQEKPKSDKIDKLISLKENLHQRFYPKTSRRSYSDISLEFPPKDRRFRKTVFVPRRDEVVIPDMQMVKIVSDVKLPEKKEQPPAQEQEEINNDIHNYGYVKNSMLPNGNEIKNLYVVPKTWLNNDEVEVQFAPSDQSNVHQAGQHLSKPMETPMECQPHSCAVSHPVQNFLPIQQQIRHPAATLSYNPQTLLPENVLTINHENIVRNKVHENSSPGLFQATTPQTVTSEAHSETDLPKMISDRTMPQMISASAVPNPLCDNANIGVVKTTIAKSLIDHTHKVIKVWSEDTDSRSSGKEVHITHLPQHDDLISGDNFETEMVHVRYEINDDQIVFIPESEDGHSSNEKDTSELIEKKNGPLLILTVQDNEPVSTELRGVEAVGTSAELKTDTNNTGRKEKSMILKSILQSDDFVSPSKIQMNKLVHKLTSVKRSVSASAVIGMPDVSASTESLNSSSAQPPTASNSNISCQRLFSSPESVRPEDIQGWYKSSDSSRDNSNLVMQPWNEFETPLLPEYNDDFSVLFGTDSPLPEKEDKRQENLIVRQAQGPSCTISPESFTKSTFTEDLLECNQGTIDNYMDEQVLESVQTDIDSTSRAFTHNGTTADRADYGSPPELERMVILPQSSTPDPNVPHVLGQHTFIPSSSECESSFDTLDKKPHKPAELAKPNVSVIQAVTDKCQKDQLETVIDQLYELSKASETKSHIHMLICQIYKIKEMNTEFDEDNGLKNCQRQKIVDMIVKQVSSLIACETAAHFMDENAGIYSKTTEETMCKQKRLLKKVVEKGVDLITSLTGEYEKTVDKRDDSNLEASTSGCEESQRQAPVEDTDRPLLETGDGDTLSKITPGSVVEPAASSSEKQGGNNQTDSSQKSQEDHANMHRDEDSLLESNERGENKQRDLDSMQKSQELEENKQKEHIFMHESSEQDENKQREQDSMLKSPGQGENEQREQDFVPKSPGQDENNQREQDSLPKSSGQGENEQREQDSVPKSPGQDENNQREQDSMQKYSGQGENKQREQDSMPKSPGQDENNQREQDSMPKSTGQDENMQRIQDYFLELQERDENKQTEQESLQILQEKEKEIQPQKKFLQLVHMNPGQTGETDNCDEQLEDQHDCLDTGSLDESNVGNGSNELHQPQDLVTVSKSTSGTSLLGIVSNVALNVEIGSTTSNESVLPSLSEVLRDTSINRETSQIVKREKTRKPDSEEDKENLDSRSKNHGDDDDDDNDGDDDDDDDEDYDDDGDDVDEEEGSKNGEVEEEEFQPRRRSCRQSRQQDNKKRKLLWQCDEEEGDLTVEQNSASTPKKRRGNESQSLATQSKGNKTNNKPGKKKKKSKTKDIYASSSEEVIPAPVKRGFQYTDECFKVFNIVYNHVRSDPFCKEIRSADIPDYYKVVKRAMWLDLIAQKLRTGKYERLEQYVADMRLVFQNSRRFNKNDSEIYESGLICEKLFEAKLAEQFPDKKL